MDSLTLTNYARNDPFISRSFLGTFSTDQLIKIKNLDKYDNFSAVINSCPSWIRGEASALKCHWYCIVKTTTEATNKKKKKVKIYFFDSSGNLAYSRSTNIINFLKRQLGITTTTPRNKNKKKQQKNQEMKIDDNELEFNSHQIQHDLSLNCGIYCLVFLALYMRGFKTSHILKQFNRKDLLKNESFIEDLFESIFIKKMF